MAVDLALAPGVQGVVDEAAAFEEPLVVGLGVEAALADGQQPRPQRVAVEVAGDVGGVDDAGQPDQGGVAAEPELVDEDLEGAAVALVGELRAGRVERPGTVARRDAQDLVRGHVGDRGVRVDEAADQPGAGDPVGLGALAGDPLHGVPPSRATWTWWAAARRRSVMRVRGRAACPAGSTRTG